MRFKQLWSIMALADYGKFNVKQFMQSFTHNQMLNFNEEEQTKLMYLMQHDGLGTTRKIINGTFEVSI